MMKARTSAFTLIELLVVIVLIGILAVIMAPDYLRFRQQLDLNNSLSLLQTGLNEAYSMARSRSRHFLVRVNQNDGFFQIRECDDFNDADGYDCDTSFEVLSPSGSTLFNLEGNTQLSSESFEVHFYAPHGDMFIHTPNGANPLTVTLDNNNLASDLTLYSDSGLITTDTP